MLKILTAEQIKRADLYTIKNEPIASIELMERAAQNCVEWICNFNEIEKSEFCILCGPGNNGGDGAAIARMLQEKGYKLKAYLPENEETYSKDLFTNYIHLKNSKINLKNLHDFLTDNFAEDVIIIDALFGSGLSKPLDGIFKEVVEKTNTLPNLKISIDIPSGLYADKTFDIKSAAIVKADYTLSLQLPKLAFLFPENEFYTGTWLLIPIELNENFIKSEPSPYFLIEHADIKSIHKPRNRFSHKGTFGHALVIGGSKGKIGSAVLMSKACLRSGAGLVTAQIPACGLSVLQTAIPEVMAIPDISENYLTTLPDLSPYNAIALGPGIGLEKETSQVLKLLIQQAKVPLVLDADALNILANNQTWISFLPQGTILTPHPGEFSRLCGKTENSFDQLEILKTFCVKHKIFVILKGAHTITCTPLGNCYFNTTGNPGMATAGSGDTLTGILVGLLAQNYSPIDACLTAVYLHGLAGDYASKTTGFEALIANDIISNIGEAFRSL